MILIWTEICIKKITKYYAIRKRIKKKCVISIVSIEWGSCIEPLRTLREPQVFTSHSIVQTFLLRLSVYEHAHH
jgi:hypothetical protein